jgi:hypothetical protein
MISVETTAPEAMIALGVAGDRRRQREAEGTGPNEPKGGRRAVLRLQALRGHTSPNSRLPNASELLSTDGWSGFCHTAKLSFERG